MKNIRKSVKFRLLAGIIIAGFLIVPFLHGSHSFHYGECETQSDSYCYACKFAKAFTFALTAGMPAVAAPFVFDILFNDISSLIEPPLVRAFASRAPPCFL